MNANLSLAPTAPITWTASDGRTVTAHLPAANTSTVYASDAHTSTVAQLAEMPQQVQLDSSVSGTGVTDGVAALFLGCLIWYAVKHKNHSWGWMVVGVAMGTFIGAGSIGVMIHDTVGQLLASAINSLGGMA